MIFINKCLILSLFISETLAFSQANHLPKAKGFNQYPFGAPKSNNQSIEVEMEMTQRTMENEEKNDESPKSSSSKTLILIRHGCSEANEYMYREGNQWGDPTFTDDPVYVDSTLSEKGVEQAKVLQREWANGNAPFEIIEALREAERCSERSSHNNGEAEKLLDHMLLVTSPLTRTIQTMNIGVLPHFEERDLKIRVMAQPLATERVYTASDTGRPIPVLQDEFPHIDFDAAFGEEDDYVPPHRHKWWYTHDEEDNHPEPYKEWRPSEKEQYYAVPGEPKHIFHRRMVKLHKWISSREERVIILVTHWGIIRFLTGEEINNCGVRILNFEETELKELSQFDD